jgi:hypothetical protein
MPVSKTESVVWDGWWTVAIDVFMHIIPFLFVIYTYGTYYWTCSNTLIPLLNTIILILLYLGHVRNVMAYFRLKGDVFAVCGRIHYFHSIQCMRQDVATNASFFLMAQE